MSTGYIGAGLRRRVMMRAERLCEYCLIHEDDTFYGCEVDHIISEKHGGQTVGPASWDGWWEESRSSGRRSLSPAAVVTERVSRRGRRRSQGGARPSR